MRSFDDTGNFTISWNQGITQSFNNYYYSRPIWLQNSAVVCSVDNKDIEYHWMLMLNVKIISVL